jgi:hypothetical protein
MKLLSKLTVVVVLVLALLSTAGVAFAQDDIPPDFARRIGVRGEVTGVADDSFTIERPNGNSITVNVGDETRIWLVDEQRPGSLSDIEVGNFVGVRGHRNDDVSIDARIVLVLLENPRNLDRARGKVTAIEGRVIVVEDRQGNEQRITTDENTRFRLGGHPGSLDDINIDDPILALGKRENGEFLARLVAVITGEQLRKHTLRGEVLSVNLDEGSLVVEGRGQKEGIWTVFTTDDTKYRIRGVEDPLLEDIEVGDEVGIIGRKSDNDSHSGVARLIVVIPEALRDAIRVRGEVSSVSGASFTVDDPRGKFTVLTDDTTRYRTRGDRDVSFDDIEVGRKALVLGRLVEDDDTVQAKVVGIQPPSSDES